MMTNNKLIPIITNPYYVRLPRELKNSLFGDV